MQSRWLGCDEAFKDFKFLFIEKIGELKGDYQNEGYLDKRSNY